MYLFIQILMTPESFPRTQIRQFLRLANKMVLEELLEISCVFNTAKTIQELRHGFSKVRNVWPFEHIIGGVVNVDVIGALANQVALTPTHVPEESIHLYVQNHEVITDPALLAHIKSRITQWWNLPTRPEPGDKEPFFTEQAQAFGLPDGMSVGSIAHHSVGDSFFCFSGSMPTTMTRHRLLLGCLSSQFHTAFLRVLLPTVDQEKNAFTRQEMNVLWWIKEGKTNWEIGRILGITERTVKFHAKNIYRKCGITSRVQAVSQILSNPPTPRPIKQCSCSNNENHLKSDD